MEMVAVETVVAVLGTVAAAAMVLAAPMVPGAEAMGQAGLALEAVVAPHGKQPGVALGASRAA